MGKGGWLTALTLLLLQSPPTAATSVLAEVAATDAVRSHMLWQVRGTGRGGWLYGSIHYAREDFYPLAEAVERAWRDSDLLAVEVDVESMSRDAMREYTTRAGIYANDTNLTEHLDDRLWQRVEKAALGFKVPLVLIQQQRPWLAAFTLTALALRRDGWREDLGLDRHFLRRAREQRKVVELEGFNRQIDLFAGLSAAHQALLLEATLDEIDAGTEAFGRIIDAWLSADVERLYRLVNESVLGLPGGGELHRRLVLERNHAITERVVALMEDGVRPFVVVGAGHLAGPEGIPALLAARGYEVRQAQSAVAQ